MTIQTATTISLSRPLIGERERAAVMRVLESGHLAMGEVVAEFEREFAALHNARHCIATSSGTTALHLALLALGIGPGDEVITSPFSFIASANAILFCGATPVFADIDPATFNLDPERTRRAITARTRAILPVHLFGQPADMDAFESIAREHGLKLIEDACQAHCARWNGRPVGTADVGCFSFYPTKNITTAEGGAITTNNDELADHLRLLRNHGMRRRYYHDILGYNFRLTDVQAAIGLAQLGSLSEWTAIRRANAAEYDRRLTSVVTPSVDRRAEHVYHQYTVRIRRDREAAIDTLTRRGVGTSIYYPVPIHQQAVYADRGLTGSFPEAERAAREVLSIPIRPDLTVQERERVIDAVNELV